MTNAINQIIIITSLLLSMVGCSQGVAPSESALRLAQEEGLEELATGEPSGPTGLYYDHPARGQQVVEQWLRVVNFDDDAAAQDATLCQAFFTAPNRDVVCADTDAEGRAVVYWAGPEMDYRVTATMAGTQPFAMQGRTGEGRTDLVGRPVRVLNDVALEGLYSGLSIERNSERHTVMVRAAFEGELSADVSFSLTRLDTVEDDDAQVVYADEAGSFDAALESTSAHGDAAFVNVATGHYRLSAERDGKACDSALVWTDGHHGQLIAPELNCN